MDKRQPIETLEKAMAVWEEGRALTALLNESARINRGGRLWSGKNEIEALSKARNFRQFLRSLPSRNLENVPIAELAPFLLPGTMIPDLSARLHDQLFLISLASWTMSSRRVFMLSRELQAILQIASLRDVKWSHVKMPFGSFAIQLATPIPGPNGHTYDFVIISEFADVRAGTQIALFAFSSKYRTYEPLGWQEIDRLEKVIATRKWRQAEGEANRGLARIHQDGDSQSLHLPKNVLGDMAVVDTANHVYAKSPGLDPEYRNLMDQVARIAFGLALYFRSARDKSKRVTQEKYLPLRMGQRDRTLITNDADIFSVTGFADLTLRERLLLGLEQGQRPRGVEMSCHWVVGHTRRSPGQGGNPNAPFDVEVDDYIARRDRLIDGSAPGGLGQIV